MLALAAAPGAHGHGIGYELLPPVRIGGGTAALEVTSSQYEDPDNPDREIQFALLEGDGGPATVRDVTYRIAASKGGAHLFELDFRADDGIFVLVLEGGEGEGIELREEAHGGFFESVVGLQQRAVHASGIPFATGGLYRFSVEISTAGSYAAALDPPAAYEVGLSVPDRTSHEVDDPNFGRQTIGVTTYYDEIAEFAYDPARREIAFSMPFEWDEANIGEISTVHEEVTIPKGFGDLMVAEYDVAVNGAAVDGRAVVIDDFAGDERAVHVSLFQGDLRGMAEEGAGDWEGMRFSISPAPGSPLSTLTENGQFRVSAELEPGGIRSGGEAAVRFNITDVFLRDRPAAVRYDLSLVQDGRTIASSSGTSGGKDGGRSHGVLVADVPEGSAGAAVLLFENLGGSRLARAALPVVVDRVAPAAVSIPDWVRSSAGWWAEGLITDRDFAGGIQYLVEAGTILVPLPEGPGAGGAGRIPDWVRSSAGWWAEGLITDRDFAGGIQYLVSEGIIRA